MNYPLDTGLNTKALCKWVPRMKGPLPERRISASDERVGTGQGGSLGQKITRLS